MKDGIIYVFPEEEEFFTWWEPQPYLCEHERWVKWGKMHKVWLLNPNVPINYAVVGEPLRGLKKQEELNVELRFLFLEGEFFKDEAEYYRESKSNMAAESYIPSGTFSPTNDPDFVETPTVLMGGTVVDVEEMQWQDERVFKIDLRFDDHIFRVIAQDGFGDLGIHVGNIIRGSFHVLGRETRPSENTSQTASNEVKA